MPSVSKREFCRVGFKMEVIVMAAVTGDLVIRKSDWATAEPAAVAISTERECASVPAAARLGRNPVEAPDAERQTNGIPLKPGEEGRCAIGR